jgi:hypothetical protein
VHPAQFGIVTADRAVREFQVRQRGDRLQLRVMLHDHARAGDVATRLGAAVTGRLAALGVAAPQVDVQPVAALERGAGGKLPLVVAERAPVAVG